MSKDFEFNLSGLNELMKSGEMCAILNEAAAKIAADVGEGYEIEYAHPISFVAIAAVRATTKEANNAAMQDNTLEIARGGARL